jgi:NADH-quinone oxidoreductase subunit F
MTELVHRTLDQQTVRSLADYVSGGGGVASNLARSASPNEIIGLLQRSGLQGRGGAGFPTGVKWETVAASRSTSIATTVVVNAAEGEPGTFKDRALLRTNPYRVLEGAIVAAIAMQTDQIRIGIKATFGREIDRLTAAIEEMRSTGWLDGLDVTLTMGPSSYLFGEETALLEVLEGRQPFPRVTPPYRRGLEDDDTRSAGGTHLAAIGGSDEPPALVDNVETLANVALIVAHGPEWFREVGTDLSPGTIVCTVSGATRRSGVGEVPMGTTLREVIDLIGWGPLPGAEIGVVLPGTANPHIPSSLLDTPLTHEAVRAAGSGLGSAGFIVFDTTTDPLAIAAGVARFLSVESCGQCEPCKSDGLVIAEHLARALHVSPTARDRRELDQRIDTVAVGARCNLARQQEAIARSVEGLYANAPQSGGAGLSGSGAEPIFIAPMSDLVGGRAVLDMTQASKQPDWSHHQSDSGTAPASFLGDTPVQITSVGRPRSWPEWSATVTAEHPLEIIDQAHDEIGRLLDVAIASGGADEGAVHGALAAIGIHIDVTRRILYPMLRRVGGDDGSALADTAEDQEQVVLRSSHAVASASAEHRAERIKNLSVELQRHADLDDRVIDLLLTCLDPDERTDLADGLAEATATSTVSP